MATHHRKLKTIQFALDTLQFECQVQTWNLNPGVEEGERMYSYCPEGGSFTEEDDPEPVLEMTFYSDWRSDGISDFLWQNKGMVADFVLDHHPDIPDEHVQWTGQVRLIPPPVGGDARSTEMSQVTLPIQGEPVYGRGV